MNNTPQIYEILNKVWGYKSFLHLQEETILSMLDGEDSLTLLPTGGGKSLCFQLPALLKEGMAVVISPLISLMKDQVDNLKDMGIFAACLNSSLSNQQQSLIIEQIYQRKIKLLYISPERLRNEVTIELLKAVVVSFFVIDEAHCVSHWGHDFRADYRNLNIIKDIFSDVSVHAFTATAVKEVQIDIIEQLKLINPKVYVGSVDRSNLTYRVLPRKMIVKQITDVLNKHDNEAGIVYCLRRKDVDKISSDLKKLGIDNVRYHAGMSDKERHISQERFTSEEVNLIIATIAFGMGIDRSNIRFIVHAGMPKSIEHYQQETGRAGRDGLSAYCYLFYGGGDYRLWSFFAQKSSEREVLIGKLRSIYNFCIQPQCRHRILVNYFSQNYNKKSCEACDYCLNELEMVEDAFRVGQMVLTCVDMVKQRDYGFGAGYVTDVLKGKFTEKIEQRKHHDLLIFGAMSEKSEPFIRYMIEQLAGQGFLAKEGEFLTLSVTSVGRRVLSGELSPMLVEPLLIPKKKEIARKSRERREIEWEEVDTEMFQVLREKRIELAQKRGVPAYIIFGDKTLRDMATKKPLDRDAFSTIYGVGDNKLKSYADIFIQSIKDYLEK
ncbi:MAG: DNA helicase RecQ [Candidatus Omnitrophica bacterium]|nr:DNA helicase RecQ [Candidatus Omnitrophota bacterium]